MIIETSDLTKMYGKRLGARRFASLWEGQIFGFSGRAPEKAPWLKFWWDFSSHQRNGKNGAPLGIWKPGEKRLFTGKLRYQDWLTGEELLSFHASLYGLLRRIKRRFLRCSSRWPERQEEAKLRT